MPTRRRAAAARSSPSRAGGYDDPCLPPTRGSSALMTKGAKPKHTSGPSCPSAIALRTIGLIAYATDAATAGAAVPASGRTRRYAPKAPRGSAPATTSVRPRSLSPKRTDESSAIKPNTGDAAVSAPIMAYRHGAKNVDQSGPAPGQSWKLPTSGTRSRTSDRDPNAMRKARPIAATTWNVRAPRAHVRHRGARAIRDFRQAIARVQTVGNDGAHARAAAHHEIADVAVVDPPHPLRRGSCTADAGAPAERGEPAREQRTSASRTAREHERDRFGDVQQERKRQDPEQRDRRVGLGEHAYAAASERLEVALVVATRRPGVLHRRAPVPNPGIRRDEHPCAGEARPPTQVEIVGSGERRGVETTELVEQVGADEHRPRPTRRRRHGPRRAAPGRSHRVRSPRTGRRSGPPSSRPRAAPRGGRSRRAWVRRCPRSTGTPPRP